MSDDLTGLVARPASTAAPADDISHLTNAPPPNQAARPAPADDISHLTQAPAVSPADDISHLTRPDPGYLPTLAQTGARNVVDLVDNLNEMVRAPTVLGKAWGGVKAVGSAFSILFTPIEAGITEFAGRPIEQATGGRVSAETVGEIGSIGAMFFVDPIGMLGTGAKAVGATKVARDIHGFLSPQTMTPEAQRFGDIAREFAGRESKENVVVEEALKPYQGMLNRLPHADRLDYIDRIRKGLQQPTPERQAAADVFRQLQDRVTIKLQAMGRVLGKNILKDADEFYHGLIWKGRTPEERAAREEFEHEAAKRPLRGSGAFLKQKVYPDIATGYAAGDELITTDPVALELMKFREQHKFLYGSWQANAMKKSGIAKFFRVGETIPPGMAKLDDRVFKAILPPVEFTAQHNQAFDEGLRAGLQRVANFLGIKVRNPLRSQDPNLAGAYGYTYGKPGAPVTSAFGNESVILEHEIGHQIDAIFGMQRLFEKNPAAWAELGRLAQGRVKDFAAVAAAHPQYAAYLLNPSERLANLWHAYWHTPEDLKRIAPTAYTMLRNFIDHNPRAGFKDAIEAVRPTLRVAGDTQAEVFSAPGLRHVGEWYAPREAARVFNNYTSPSRLATPLFEGMRSVGMGLNMLQLGLSAFHATFTTVDTMVSQLALSLESAFAGEFGRAIAQAAAVPIAPFTTVRAGARLRRAVLNPRNLTREEQAMAEAFQLGGGRVRMDAFYRATERSLVRSLKDGTLIRMVEESYRDKPMATALALPFKIAGAAISDISHPVMDYLVPRQKLGVFSKLAHDWLRRNPNADRTAHAAAMRKIWDSVDNRLGQMVYDNVFWSRTFKDLMFMVTRSVGWNLGTVRELGGGVVDTARAIHALRMRDQAEFTHRMAYAIAMPIVTGIIGATLTYLYTGRGPREMNDYFFPPTGGKTPRGGAERVIIPSYIKDVLEYNSEPVHTVLSKLNPLWATVAELYNNRDFYGGLIRDPTGDFATQAKEFSQYFENQMLPFSIRSAQRLGKEKSGLGKQVGSFFGLQAAPAWITDPARAAAFQKRQDIQALRRRMREQATK